MTVVVSISSAMPFAILPITLAEAGATSTTSACFASATCSTLYWKFRSKVSIRHLFPVSCSKVSGVINSVAFFVISTCTLAPSLRSIRARFTILYAAILPVTPSTAVFPFNVFLSNVICYSSRFIPLDYRGISHFFQYKGPRTFYLLELQISLCYHYPVIVLYPLKGNNNKEEN